MLCKSSTSTRQPLLDQFSSKDRSNSAISSRSCTISMRRVPLSTLLMNDCGRPEPLNTVLGSGQPPSCVSSVGSAGLRVRVCRHWNLGKGKSRRRAASFRACMSNQAKSVATASRQITWANSWQRISPSVVAILLICPAYIAGTPHCRHDAVNELQVHTAAPWSIGADQEFSLPTP